MSVVTDRIERFTETGIALASGAELEADIVVTATGLVVKLLGGIELAVDGARVNVADRFSYKGMMLSDVPNLAVAFGYTNASWTLKCDLTSRNSAACSTHGPARLWHLRAPARRARRRAPADARFQLGLCQRAAGHLPGQGPRPPWRVHQNYLKCRDHCGEFNRSCRTPSPSSATERKRSAITSRVIILVDAPGRVRAPARQLPSAPAGHSRS